MFATLQINLQTTLLATPPTSGRLLGEAGVALPPLADPLKPGEVRPHAVAAGEPWPGGAAGLCQAEILFLN